MPSEILTAEVPDRKGRERVRVQSLSERWQRGVESAAAFRRLHAFRPQTSYWTRVPRPSKAAVKRERAAIRGSRAGPLDKVRRCRVAAGGLEIALASSDRGPEKACGGATATRCCSVRAMGTLPPAMRIYLPPPCLRRSIDAWMELTREWAWARRRPMNYATVRRSSLPPMFLPPTSGASSFTREVSTLYRVREGGLSRIGTRERVDKIAPIIGDRPP